MFDPKVLDQEFPVNGSFYLMREDYTSSSVLAVSAARAGGGPNGQTMTGRELIHCIDRANREIRALRAAVRNATRLLNGQTPDSLTKGAP